MKTVKIRDGKGERREVLGGIAVQSSGGVPPAWAALTAQLPRRGRVLDFGSWQGLAALWLKAAELSAEVEFAHTSAALLAQVGDNAQASSLALRPRASFPLASTWETIALAAPPQNDALEMLAVQGAYCLADGGGMLVVDRQLRREVLCRAFACVEEVDRGENWSIARCTRPLGQGELLPWQRISVRVRGLELELHSLPGNFSSQGLDQGTRALLETAAIPPGGRVLDLACGYGVVGIVADRLGAGEVVYIDDDLIALTACRHNLESLGLEGELVHSHEPGRAQGKFDCILTNPPYHADYGVARSFVEFAAASLEDGGWLHVVVKKPDWYVNKIRALFGGCKVLEQDGYSVISAQLRRSRPRTAKAVKTTRKHARRLEAAQGRRRGNV
jgi:16S rRNA (guanine1207-N2)-methyltransferase